MRLFAPILALIVAIASPIIALTADEQAALDVHNQNRATKSVPALVWNANLQAAAQTWANKLASTNGPLQHGSSGENLYWRSPAGTGALTAGSKAWLAEASNYNGQVIPQGNFAAYGHYTQAMWNKTLRVGIAQAKDSKGGVYVVARYDPPGNVVGQKPY